VSGSVIHWAICKSAPRSSQITMPVPHHSVFYRPDALPAAQPPESKHWRQNILSDVLQRNTNSIYCHVTKWKAHTQTRLTAFFAGLPGSADTRKVKPSWILLKQGKGEWQWHQLGYMQVCTSLQTDNQASTPPLRCPSCHPTNSVKALKMDVLQCNTKIKSTAYD